jgi:acetylornithine deacetylase/succinyl-diaminopimelate desuccinylase-like protein
MEPQEQFKQFDKQLAKFKEELFSFLRIPSVSSESEYAHDVLNCASWVEDFLNSAGLKVQRWTGEGHPTIFAEHIAGPEYPTVLFYNHYDVQPVDPIEEWKSPPFEPTERDGKIFARGAQDNKGQCFYTMAAIRDLLKNSPNYPMNIKLIVEGEEETGSGVLHHLLSLKADFLSADYLVIPDVGVKSLDDLSVSLGARGITSMTITVRGSNTDLHSGMVGGIVYNPNRAAAEIIASLYADDGKVAVKDFYKDVVSLTAEEEASYDFGFDKARFRKVFDSEETGGEKGIEPLVRAWMRPTVEINGVNGGYSGSGFKTVIPAQTIIKLSARLVPNQTPEKISKLIKEHIEANSPVGVQVEVSIHAGPGKPVRTSSNTSIAKLSAQAVSEAFSGKKCNFIATGGSLPVISELAEISGAETVFLGLGLDTDQIHAPNEHFSMERVRYGYVVIGRLIELLRKS